MATSYIPAPDALFNDWVINFSTKLTDSPTTYALSAADALIVAGVRSTWVAAYALAVAPATRTSGTIASKDAARLSAEATIRPFAVAISLSPAVTNAAKVDIGVTVRSTVPTPVPAPTTAPILAIESAIPLQQTLRYAEPGAAGKYKPAGVIGCEVFRSVGTVAATDPAQASYVGTVTKAPFKQSFVSSEQGKVVTYFARWSTRSGPGGVSQSGPFSAPLVLTVM